MTDTFETTLAEAQRAVEAVLKTAGTTTSQLRKARVSAGNGQIRDLRRALKAAQDATATLAAQTKAVADGFDFDEQAYLSDGRFTKELLAAAADAGVSMQEEDERIVCYPSLIKILPGEAAVEVDKKRDRGLRPSVLIARLAAIQGRAPTFKPEPFIDSLRNAYELAVKSEGKKPDAVVKLVDLWAILTLLPGQSREYTKQEFARDLYLLDQSGVTHTAKSKRQLRLAASTGTKGAGVLTTVARGGQQQRYWGVYFTEGGA